MNEELEKIQKARLVLQKIAKGINPVNGEQIEQESFLNDPRIIRCFYYVAEVLDNVAKGAYSSRRSGPGAAKFFITPEQKARVQFPEGKIGVNEFSKCINMCIDLNESKKLTGVELNKRLKALGILSEEQTEEGKTRTVINDNSKNYGFESEKKNYNGVEYEMVMINDKGKQYLLENIEEIMKAEIPSEQKNSDQ
ncbi:hypothetical protein [Lutispora saccharofermentans]|uniref:Uncharacterized protein n=1 Tax=Lutispora saccharofermentans TaxID=3024236 RepID=A0ABT1NIQ7_9FIRM|nr:hypothetical protein [Lutispora saccharofermentans]MCQ1530181.1 hypothetical protein [Lutispora saccharofermentans]